MLHRLRKFLLSSTYIALFVVFFATVFGAFDSPRCESFGLLSLICLGLASLKLPAALDNYEDRLARRLVFVPVYFGFALAFVSILALHWGPSPFAVLYALAGIGGLYTVHIIYKKGSENFQKVGAGWLPKDIWLNPPLEAIQEGDWILTDGRMARRARNSVGHSEFVVRKADGTLQVASSYIETGVCIHTLRAFIKMENKAKENYVVLRLRKPLTAAQSVTGWQVAQRLETENDAWQEAENKKRRRIFSALPIPKSWKEWLLKYALSTGYDPLGKYWGGERTARWTCMGHNLRIAREMGIPVSSAYGTGAFGLFGEINPLVPIRLLKDPAYRPLTLADQAASGKA